MKNLSKTLYQFWSGFTWNGEPVPAYKSGDVPQGAAFPYFTFGVSRGGFGGKGPQTAILWCQHAEGLNVNEQRAAIMDEVAKAIPEGGRMFAFDSGGMMVWRNDADFMTDYVPDSGSESAQEAADNGKVIGGRISVIVQSFIA